MTEKHKKLLKDKIEELGLYNASRLFGLSMAEILNYSKIKITASYANDVLLELMDGKKIPTEYKGLNIEHNGDGGVKWFGFHNTNEFGVTLIETIFCLATPFPHGADIIPIDFDYYCLDDRYSTTTIFEYEEYGDYTETIDVEEEFENLEKLLEWYRDFYLPQVYDKIVNECLPMIREYNKEDILKEIDDYFN